MPTTREQTNALRQAIRIDPNYDDAKIRLQTLQKPVEKIEPLPRLASQLEVTSSAPLVVSKPNRLETVSRITKYTVYKGVLLFFTIAVGVYITILIANLGGYIDEIFRGEIASSIMGMAMAGAFDDMSQEEKDARIAQIEWQMEEDMGLHKSFLLRTFGFLVNGLTLNLGEAYMSAFFRGVFQGANQSVQITVLERLPYTILLVGVSNFLFFFVSVFVALFLSRNYGGIMDRISVLLAALMSAPSWIYGIVLIVLLAGQLQILPFPKTIDLKFAELTPEYIRLVLSQMVMPVMAIFLSLFFTGVFAWRTFFLIYSGEDYVDMAKAQGLSNRVIERRYILKPSMPYVITSFALMIITLWEGSIALEVLFRWPGIGSLFYQAVSNFNPTSEHHYVFQGLEKP